MRLFLSLFLALTACGTRADRSGSVRPPRGDAGLDAGPVDTGPVCTPACAGRECGDDGCGGSCGTCPAAAPFCVNAMTCAAQCTPDCTGRECGDDGCGGSCGTCPMAAPNCVGNVCMVGCTPDCTGRECGDDGCGGSCGTCTTGSCAEGMCTQIAGCNAAEAQCSDMFSYEVCGIDAVGATSRSFGPRIPCWNENTCSSGVCGGQCGTPEVLLVVDRSSSMQGARWDFVSGAIIEFTEMNQNRASFGLRMFPSGAGCGVGGIVSIAPFNAGPILDGLDAPSTDSQTPIGASLAGAESAFGDPNQGQAIVLITDGDETCSSDPNEAVLQAEILARSGIQVFVIGVSTMANPTLMAAIASAGRTGNYASADDGPAVFSALGSVLSSLDVCQSGAGSIGDPCSGAGDCSGAVCLTNQILPWPDGYCSQDCTTTACPTGSSCTPNPVDPSISICLKSCVDIADCRSGYICNVNVCIPG